MSDKKENELTPKIEMFCQEFVQDFNGTQAAIRAGYSEKTATVQASQLLTKLNVQERIRELTKARSEKIDVTSEMIIKELANIGFSNINDFLKVEEVSFDLGLDEEGKPIIAKRQAVVIFDTKDIDPNKVNVISSIKSSRDGIELKLHDKLKALEMLGKHIGFFEKDNEQQNKIILRKNVSDLFPDESEINGKTDK